MKRIIAKLIGGTGLLLALLTLTSCDNADNPAGNDATEEQLQELTGHWYAELPISGETENWRTEEEGDMTTFDTIGAVIYLNGYFTDACYWGYIFLQDGEMVNYDGLHRHDEAANFEIKMDRDGNITASSHLAGAPQVTNMHYANGVITADVSYRENNVSLVFHRTETDEEKTLKAFYDILVEEGIIGGNTEGDDVTTDVADDGADQPARSRQQ